MKMKNIVGVLLLVVVSQSVVATVFKVSNCSGLFVDVDAVWQGKEREWIGLQSPEEIDKYNKCGEYQYNSWNKKVLGLLWREGGFCYSVNLDQYNISPYRLWGVEIKIGRVNRASGGDFMAALFIDGQRYDLQVYKMKCG
jgi:hypothetical protein